MCVCVWQSNVLVCASLSVGVGCMVWGEVGVCAGLGVGRATICRAAVDVLTYPPLPLPDMAFPEKTTTK